MAIAVAEWRALGMSVRVITANGADIGAARTGVERVLDDIDCACSRFRSDSELSRAHAAGGREVQVSPLLARAIRVALRAAEITDGAVDPTVGGAVKTAGYDVDFAAVEPDGGAITLRMRRVPGWHRVRLLEATNRLTIPAGVEVDLGATAKALAADIAAERAAAVTRDGGVLVSLGGDIAVAGAPPAGGWQIQVAENSEAPITEAGETIAIHSGGVATSSVTVRRWRRGGVEMHHIIDPETGLPARGPWRTVTVVAGTCVDANTAATAAIVRGAKALELLTANSLPARLVRSDGGVERIAGWPSAPL